MVQLLCLCFGLTYKAGGLHADFEESNLLQQLHGATIAACNLGVGQFQPEVAVRSPVGFRVYSRIAGHDWADSQ